MAFVHGKNAFVSLAAMDLSPFCNSVEMKGSADSHDTTTFGKSSHTFAGGLKNGTASLKGMYDNSVTGPRTIVQPLLGTVVALIYQPEGVGTGKPTDTVNVVVTAYEESVAVADMVMWSAECQLSDDVVTTSQV